jgi:hypothetical protein
LLSDGSEDRRHARKRTVQSGSIRAVGGSRWYPCMVRDVSASGVKLRVPIGFDVPEIFELSVPALELNRTARVAWRSLHSIGAAFEEVADIEPKSRFATP